ncbi:hypothetical protein GCM10008956_20190 [Deinococcus arenae]|uniref:Uncharacterized protein n=1 Tax=Deinococcus arenae TaxID=1452751 RepID=A0A8H9GPH5_9DEIO|nr:hypothetical protein [Deinococcus arenae]AWT35080.1 hypothetical protein DM785_05540 [Deinococcus actinosclerus]GGM43934.1 hypothetical protein GCM10008956_20190 [Deinococcus arenae]
MVNSNGAKGEGRRGARLGLPWLGLTLLGTLCVGTGSAATYTGPQAAVYIGDRWCSGGYCSGSVYAAFDEALSRALNGSGYVRPLRQPEGASLDLRGGITDVSTGGGLCLPFVGCVRGTTVRASLELLDRQTGEVRWQDACEGSSSGFSTWTWWTGSVYLDSDEGKAAADCAAKMVQKLTGSAVLRPYLTLAPGAALNSPAAPAAPATSLGTAPAATLLVRQLEGALRGLAFADLNALFSGDVLNPVKVKELNAAATAATLKAAASLKFEVAAPETAGPYQLVGVTYTLPDGRERFTQLAVTSDPALNPRGGTRLLYLSPLNPLRSSAPLDGVSRNVETLLGDVLGSLNLPGL